MRKTIMINDLLRQLNWELSILSRAVVYQNLSEAATHIAVSQPQLSRMVSKLENELKLTLLDRTAKRKSSWTASAHQLADLYRKFERRFELDIQALVSGMQISHLRIGALEGLAKPALQTGHHMLTKGRIKILELDIYDLDELEALFLKGALDLIYTSREPSRRKFKFIRKIGYQQIDWVENSEDWLVLSSYEFGARKFKKWEVKSDKLFVSNSLQLRKEWLSQFGGEGTMPSSNLKKHPQKKTDSTVFLVGNDTLSAGVWNEVEKTVAKP